MDKLIEEVNADLDIKAEGETAYYQVFLWRTQDKVIDAFEKYLINGTKSSIEKEYGDIFSAREYARKKIEEQGK